MSFQAKSSFDSGKVEVNQTMLGLLSHLFSNLCHSPSSETQGLLSPPSVQNSILLIGQWTGPEFGSYPPSLKSMLENIAFFPTKGEKNHPIINIVSGGEGRTSFLSEKDKQLWAWGRVQFCRLQGLLGSAFKMATKHFKEAARKVPRPSKLWNPFGFSVMPRRFPRQRRGNKRQPIVPLKEWKIIRGDTVSDIIRPSVIMYMMWSQRADVQR